MPRVPPIRPGQRHRLRVAHRVLVILAVVTILGLVADPFHEERARASSTGRADRAVAGCGAATCHGGNAAVTPLLGDLPETYMPGESYVLRVSVEGAGAPLPIAGNEGGFALATTDGALAVVPGDGTVQIVAGNATHSTSGTNQREWQVVWAAPPASGGEVLFYLAVNAVNGDRIPGPGDEWAVAQFTSREGIVEETRGRPTNQEPTLEVPEPESALPGPGALATVTVLGTAALLAMRRRRPA